MRGSSGVLHCTCINLDDGLSIFVVGVFNAGVFGEEAYHFGRFAHVKGRIVFTIWSHIVGDRYVLVVILDNGEVTHDQRDQVSSMRDIMSPVMGLCIAVVRDVEQVAIRDSDELSRDGDDDLGGGAIIGRVMTGKPVAMVTRLPECPGLHGTCWVFGGRLDEVQANAWLGMILNGDSEPLSMMVGAVERDYELFSVGAIGKFLAIF